ncbi:MAG: hypothetical protein M3Z06_10925 [Actinomycetota bacterium]|nr:hypothetical protein [Actinomycetota bacterium]
MPQIPFADFLAGSLLSLLLPIGLLIAIAIWYVLAVKRVPEGTTKPLPPPLPASDLPSGQAVPPADPPDLGE